MASNSKREWSIGGKNRKFPIPPSTLLVRLETPTVVTLISGSVILLICLAAIGASVFFGFRSPRGKPLFKQKATEEPAED